MAYPLPGAANFQLLLLQNRVYIKYTSILYKNHVKSNECIFTLTWCHVLVNLTRNSLQKPRCYCHVFLTACTANVRSALPVVGSRPQCIIGARNDGLTIRTAVVITKFL